MTADFGARKRSLCARNLCWIVIGPQFPMGSSALVISVVPVVVATQSHRLIKRKHSLRSQEQGHTNGRLVSKISSATADDMQGVML